MFSQVIVTLIGVSLWLGPTAAHIVDDMCNSTCDGSQLSDFNNDFEGENYVFLLPENKCYDQTTEVCGDTSTYTFYENGTVKNVIRFNTTDCGTCMRDSNGAFSVFLPIDECNDKDLALAFICPTDRTEMSGYLVTRKTAMISKTCADAVIKQLRDLNDPKFTPCDEDVYKCTRTNPV